MAVVSVTQKWSTDESALSLNDSGQISLEDQKAYDVVFDSVDPGNTHLAKFADDGETAIPAIGEPFGASSPYLRASGIRARRTQSPLVAEVVVNYTLPGGSASADNPLNAPAHRRWNTQKTEEPIDQDINGNPIQTITGEPLAARWPIRDLVLETTRNVAFFNPGLIARYEGATNADVFFGEPPGVAMLDLFAGDAITDGDLEYWEITTRVIFRRHPNTTPARAWWLRLAHRGFYEKRGGKSRHAIEIDDNPSSESFGEPIDYNGDPTEEGDEMVKVSRPVPLKEDGTRALTPDEQAWLEFQIAPSMRFAEIRDFF